MISRNKLITLLGELEVQINNISTPYKIIALDNKGRCFNVDKRYKIICDLPTRKRYTKIECKIKLTKTSDIYVSPETGEELALISFDWDNYKLCIGTLGDMTAIDYKYTTDSITVLGKYPHNQIIFYVAWLKTNSEEDGNNAWFAADPAYDD